MRADVATSSSSPGGGFGAPNRRNTLNGGGSALPLPRKSFGGRISAAGTRGFEEESLPPINTHSHGLVRRLGAKRVGED